MKDNAAKKWYSSVTLLLVLPQIYPGIGRREERDYLLFFVFCILVYSVTEAPEDNNK